MNEHDGTADLQARLGAIAQMLKRSQHDPRILEELAEMEKRLVGCSARTGIASIPIDVAAQITRAGAAWGALGNALNALGQREAALRAAQQACRHFALGAEHSVHARNLYPTSLYNLGTIFSKMGRPIEALQANQEAVKLLRELKLVKPEALAASVSNLGNRLSTLGRHTEALSANLEAVDLYYGLHKVSSKAFAFDLAVSLYNLANRFYALDRFAEAVPVIVKALELYSELHRVSPETCVPELAKSLILLGSILRVTGSDVDGLRATQAAVAIVRKLSQASSEAFAPDLATSLLHLTASLSAMGCRDKAVKSIQEAVELYRRLHQASPEAFMPDLATSLTLLAVCVSHTGDETAALAYRSQACRLLASQPVMDPGQWAHQLSTTVPYLHAPSDLREVHLAVLERIADLRRSTIFDISASTGLLDLQATLVADLWVKLGPAYLEDPPLLDDAFPILVSALQSPDLSRWLALQHQDSVEVQAVRTAELALREVREQYDALLRRQRGGSDGGAGLGPSSPGQRSEPPAGNPLAALQPAIDQVRQQEAQARTVLQAAVDTLIKIDPAFAAAYELPGLETLQAMLRDLHAASATHRADPVAPAALLCMLQLPPHGDLPARLVGILLHSEHAHVQAIDFDGLLELADRYQAYAPLGQRAGAVVRDLGETARALRPTSVVVTAGITTVTPTDTYDGLLEALRRLWWAPLHGALEARGGAALGSLHVASHGLSHHLPFAAAAEAERANNLQLCQWPGLPYLRAAYGLRTREPKPVATGPWQIGHAAEWDGDVPLPMVAVESQLLCALLQGHAPVQRVHSVAELVPNARGLVLCGHGTTARDVDSAVRMADGSLSTRDVIARKLAPALVLLPVCHAGETADDHGGNALGLSAGFLLAGARVVIGSTKAVPDTLMPWFSTLVVWYAGRHGQTLHDAACRARREFAQGRFPDDFRQWMRQHLGAALAPLQPGGQEAPGLARMRARYAQMKARAEPAPPDALQRTIDAWPWDGAEQDALPLGGTSNPSALHQASQEMASQVLLTHQATREDRLAIEQQMREMAGFIVVFGLG